MTRVIDIRFRCTEAEAVALVANSPHFREELDKDFPPCRSAPTDAPWWRPEMIDPQSGAGASWVQGQNVVNCDVIMGPEQGRSDWTVYIRLVFENVRQSSIPGPKGGHGLARDNETSKSEDKGRR
jgi:hypothetical protein